MDNQFEKNNCFIYQGSHGDIGGAADIILPRHYLERRYFMKIQRAEVVAKLFSPGEAKENWRIIRLCQKTGVC